MENNEFNGQFGMNEFSYHKDRSLNTSAILESSRPSCNVSGIHDQSIAVVDEAGGLPNFQSTDKKQLELVEEMSPTAMATDSSMRALQ